MEPSPAAQQLFLLEELARRRVEAAEVTLQGFNRLAVEVGLPPKADSSLWGALAGMSVTAATLPDASPVTQAKDALDGNAKLEQEVKQLRAGIESLADDN